MYGVRRFFKASYVNKIIFLVKLNKTRTMAELLTAAQVQTCIDYKVSATH